MIAVVFVDTNVLVYARDSSEPSKQPIAAAWLKRLWQEQSGRTSVQVLSEYYVTVTRKLKPGLASDAAWDDVSAFQSWDPQVSNRELLNTSRQIEARYRLSWWDSMIVAAAQLQNCATLLTEDLQHDMCFHDVRVVNPFRSEIRENVAEYIAPKLTVARHKSRGRPRRGAP